MDAVKTGLITEAEINRSLERLFVARFKLGMFDPPDRVPFSKIPYTEVDSAAHRKLALEAARKSIVLLKNDGTLPLKSSIRKIAVIGPAADDAEALLGNYNGFSSLQVTPLAGIEHQWAGKAEVRYALGANYTAQSQAPLPSGVLTPLTGTGRGLQAEYFDGPEFQGEPKVRRVEPLPEIQAGITDPAVATAFPKRAYSVRWSGNLHAPVSGEYTFSPRGGFGRPSIRIFLDDRELTADPPPAGAPAPGRGRPVLLRAQLVAGRAYPFRVEYRAQGPAASAQVLWAPPAAALLTAAIDAVSNADVTLAFVGLNPSLEGEEMPVSVPGFQGGDRTNLELPEPQEKLIEAAIATGKPVVVVLASGSAVAMNFAAEHANALLETWYNGEETGTAIADTLAGVNNPSGRLPVTFYKSVEQLPPFDDYAMKGRTYRYFDGEPLYGFGFGLSYSKFQYSALKTRRAAAGTVLGVRVKNTSSLEGDEVVQLYVNGGGADGDAIRALRGFQRIHLRPGESREVQFTLGKEDLTRKNLHFSIGGGQPVGTIPHSEISM